MAERIQSTDAQVPPITEEVHLPGPSFLPVITAVGITIMLVGVVQSWIIFGTGVLITVIAVWRWARSARADMAELHLEH